MISSLIQCIPQGDAADPAFVFADGAGCGEPRTHRPPDVHLCKACGSVAFVAVWSKCGAPAQPAEVMTRFLSIVIALID